MPNRDGTGPLWLKTSVGHGRGFHGAARHGFWSAPKSWVCCGRARRFGRAWGAPKSLSETESRPEKEDQMT